MYRVMLERMKETYKRAKNLIFYLTIVTTLVVATIFADTVYEVVNYKYTQKIPTISIALILITAL